MVSELTGLKSCWLFFLEYHARGVPDTHSEYRWVETSASSDVGGAGPRRRLNACDSCVKAILTNICIEFTCSPIYPLNSWLMQYLGLTLKFATCWFRASVLCRITAFCVWYGFNSSSTT